MAFDPTDSIMKEPHGDVTLSVDNDDSIIAHYRGKSLPLTLVDNRPGKPFRSETLKEGTGFREGVVTGFKALAAGVDVGRNEGIFIWKNAYYPDVTGIGDGYAWGPPAYQVWAFSLETGEITQQFTDNGGFLDINSTLDWVDFAGSGSSDYHDRLYDVLYWDHHVDGIASLNRLFNIFDYLFWPKSSGDRSDGSKSSSSKTLNAQANTDSLLQGESGDNYGNDFLNGNTGNDDLRGFRGSDELFGSDGNDQLRAGNGRDTLTGGAGVDSLYGGFGCNTFEDSNDGAADKLYLKSDQLAYNWIYAKAENSPNGEKADKIGQLDTSDQIFIQGATTAQLTFGSVTHTTPFGETWSGIGIYAAGTLEAVFTGGNLSQTQLQAITFGTPA